MDHNRLSQIVSEAVTKKYIKGAVFSVSQGAESIPQSWAAGNMKIDSPYYIASINKLFISAIILRLINEGRLTFEDTLAKFLPSNIITGLHVYEGKDYSAEINILHMLSQTSGLPCYLEDKSSDGTSIIKELEAGIDQSCPDRKSVV